MTSLCINLSNILSDILLKSWQTCCGLLQVCRFSQRLSPSSHWPHASHRWAHLCPHASTSWLCSSGEASFPAGRLTCSGVLAALHVGHLLDSASKQHSWRVMVESLQGLAGAVWLLCGHAAGPPVPVGGGGGVAALPILVSATVSVPLSLALGQRAERPLLPHPFHAAGMLGLAPPFTTCTPPNTGGWMASLSSASSLSCGPRPVSAPSSPLLILYWSRPRCIHPSFHTTCERGEQEAPVMLFFSHDPKNSPPPVQEILLLLSSPP